MKELQVNSNVTPRYVTIDGLKSYLSIGKTNADKIGVMAGAKKRIGKRVVYDLKLIDEFLDHESDITL